MTTPLAFARLFAEFRAASWAAWRRILALITSHVRELYVVAGRGSGKSRMVALLACCYASRAYRLAPGERIYVGIFAPDRKQAGITFKYIVGLLRSVPELAALITLEKAESIELSNGVTIEVLTASTAAPRGRSYALVVVEEAAFLRDDTSANPDVELVRALRPGLARVPGSLLCVVSSPYRRSGVLFNAWKRYRDGHDPRMVVVQAPTSELNPTFDADAIARALEDDPAAASAEYLAEFRGDIESYVSREAVEACVDDGRVELPPRPGVTYSAFGDPSGGRGDSFTLAIGHVEKRDGSPIAVIDVVRERMPPFSPELVVAEFAKVLASYGVSKVLGDRYAGEWPREAFKRHGIVYEQAAKPKSDLYRDALAILNGQRVELPDVARLHAQIVGLERRTARGGRDSIDHAPGAHDDMANAALGLAVQLAVNVRQHRPLTWGRGQQQPANEAGVSPAMLARERLAWAQRIQQQQHEPSVVDQLRQSRP